MVSESDKEQTEAIEAKVNVLHVMTNSHYYMVHKSHLMQMNLCDLLLHAQLTIMLYTELDAECDKQVTLVDTWTHPLSTSVVNNRPTTVACWSHSVTQGAL